MILSMLTLTSASLHKKVIMQGHNRAVMFCCGQLVDIFDFFLNRDFLWWNNQFEEFNFLLDSTKWNMCSELRTQSFHSFTQC